MSAIENKFILTTNKNLVIHFAKAVDGTRSVQLAPVTEASFENAETAVMTFTSAAEAAGYKDHLCHLAAAQESPKFMRATSYTPYSLETYCDLEVQTLERELAIA